MSGYASAVDFYRNADWLPIPLPRGKKFSPPAGFTGADGRWPDDEDSSRWCQEYADGNLALRLPEDTLGFDLDLYKAPNARIRLETLLGTPLPPTWSSSSSNDGSGIYFYRVPILGPDQRWRDTLVPGVEGSTPPARPRNFPSTLLVIRGET
jgi:hypothetical protein